LGVEEYTTEFEKLLIKCVIQESEDQTIVRYWGSLDPRYAYVVEIQQYSSFDDVCSLAHRVDQKKKSKPYKKNLPKPPLPKSSPFNKVTFQPLLNPQSLLLTPLQRTQLHKISPHFAQTQIEGATSVKA